MRTPGLQRSLRIVSPRHRRTAQADRPACTNVPRLVADVIAVATIKAKPKPNTAAPSHTFASPPQTGSSAKTGMSKSPGVFNFT